VVAVQVRVHDEANGLRAQRFHRIDNLLMHLPVHRVNEKDTITAD